MVDDRTRTVVAGLRAAAPEHEQPLRVLSLDGGGIRGLIPARVLAEIERLAGKPIAQCFDLVAGTSTGGILALGLTVPGPDGAPRWTADALVDVYRLHGRRIFRPVLWRTLGGKLIAAKYPARGLERELRARLGDAELRHALTEVLVTSWDLVSDRPLYFTRSSLGNDVAMHDAARATSAAPTYFRPKQLGERLLVDGGVFANDPALLAWQALRPEEEEEEEQGRPVLLVSIGTGRPPESDARSRRLWGLIPWARPLIDLLLSAPSELAQVELETAAKERELEYHRLEPELASASPRMDDTSAANLAALERDAEALIAKHAETLRGIAARL